MGTNGVSLNFLISFEVWLVSSYSEKTDSWLGDMVAVKTKSLPSGFGNSELRESLGKENIFCIPAVTNIQTVRYKNRSHRQMV